MNAEHIEVMQRIAERFKSANSIDVERTHITADEFAVISKALSTASPATGHPRCGDERYELDAYIWKRESTQEWVLEISGSINGSDFIARHPEPLTTSPEDVAGLPTLYATPQPEATQQPKCPDCGCTSLMYECVACSHTNYPPPTGG